MADPSVLRDERGALMIAGVFFAVFMTGMLFYVSAVSEAVLLQGRLQEAADVGAFGTAVVHARGMNLLVLLNQAMSALLAILIGLRLTQMLAALGIALASALSFVPGVAGFIPMLASVQGSAGAAYSSLDKPVHGALKALHSVEVGVAASIPGIAVAGYTVAGRGGSAVAPARPTLPVESDDFSVLCGHAGQDAAAIAVSPLEALGLDSALLGPMKEAVGDLAVQAGGWFCGRSGAKPPKIERTVDRVLPTLSARAACEAAADEGSAGRDDGTCARVAEEEARSEPDSSGACQSGCDPGGPFGQRVQKAREQCDPRLRPGLHGFHWAERKVIARFGRNGTLVRTSEGPLRIVRQGQTSRVHPCGTRQALYDEGYEVNVHAGSGTAVTPLCERILGSVGAGRDVEILEVVHVLQCRITVKKTIEMKGKDGRAGNPDDESPMRVIQGLSSASDDFQIRAGAVATSAETWIDRVVAQTAGSPRVDRPNAAVDAMSRIGIAEAEFGFDGTAPSADWMWTRRWTARLSRVRKPESSAVTMALVGACDAATGAHAACLGVGAALGPLAEQVVH